VWKKRWKNSTVAYAARGPGGICEQKKRRISDNVKPVTASLSDGSVDLVTLGQRLRHLRKSKGMNSLREDGAEKVLSGQTTIEEVLRVTQEDLI